MDRDQLLALIGTLAVIGALIYLLEGRSPQAARNAQVVKIASHGGASSAEKEKRYPQAKEIVNSSGFVNVENLSLADLIGKQVILVDFWTYSCINCQRTQPYLNAWQEKYGDKGLTIVGVHTPEFEFEKDIANVRTAVAQAGITYPVVLDNDYATWQAYGNRYWPRKYLIDIDGYIVYDHIGEGGYEETETVIQELLAERQSRLGEVAAIDRGVVTVAADVASEGVGSPEVYFGAHRNELLANGRRGVVGEQELTRPAAAQLNELVLDGRWNILREFATNTSGGATITFRYRAKDVHMVAAADQSVTVTVRQDGQLLGRFRGTDITDQSQVTISEERLYNLVTGDAVGEHTLELLIEGPGLQAFTFTFG